MSGEADKPSKFEVGKKYKQIHSKHWGECVYSGDQVAIVKNGTLEYAQFQASRNLWEEVKPKKVIEGWLNIYPIEGNSVGFNFHKTKQAADAHAAFYRVDCIPFRHEY